MNTATRRQAVLMISPAVLVLLVVGIFPMFYTLYLLVHKWVLTSPRGPKYIGIDNFTRLIEDERFRVALGRTFTFSFGVVTAEFALGLLVALLLVKMRARLFRLFFLFPMIIAPTVVGLMWRFMFNDEIGVINYLLGLIGIDGPLWLGDPGIALLSLMLVDLWQWTPFIIMILFAGLISLPTDLEEAAYVDGAGYWTTLLFIKLPLLRQAIFVAVFFRLIDALRTFDTIFVLTAGGPNNVTEVMSIYTYKVSFRFFELTYGAVLAFILLVIILVLSRFLVPIMKRH